jgi:hypothetical protein
MDWTLLGKQINLITFFGTLLSYHFNPQWKILWVVCSIFLCRIHSNKWLCDLESRNVNLCNLFIFLDMTTWVLDRFKSHDWCFFCYSQTCAIFVSAIAKTCSFQYTQRTVQKEIVEIHCMQRRLCHLDNTLGNFICFYLSNLQEIMHIMCEWHSSNDCVEVIFNSREKKLFC